jgi:hypothetical protein
MNQTLKGIRNFLIIYGAIFSGVSFISILTNLPTFILGDTIILPFVLMPSLLPVALAYLFFGIRFNKIHLKRSVIFLWINILSLFWYLIYLAVILLYIRFNKNQQDIHFHPVTTILNFLSPLIFAAAFIVPGMIILIKQRKLEKEDV